NTGVGEQSSVLSGDTLTGHGYGTSLAPTGQGASVFDVLFAVDQVSSFDLNGEFINNPGLPASGEIGFFSDSTGAYVSLSGGVYDSAGFLYFSLSGLLQPGVDYHLVVGAVNQYVPAGSNGGQWTVGIRASPAPEVSLAWLVGVAAVVLFGPRLVRRGAL
ncbi:MAG: hypothetical protein ACHQ6T_08040, partial [Myxococcota bacterium]